MTTTNPLSEPYSTETLRERSATLVMGWTARERSWAYTGGATLWFDEQDVGLLPVQSWRPDERPDQCLQLIESMRVAGFEFEIRSADGTVTARFASAAGGAAERIAETFCVAVVEAAVAAREAM